jgi:ankyrin repeat protein
LIDELVNTPQAGAHRGFYRPHSGFPVREAEGDPLDEALAWAARAGRTEAVTRLIAHGANPAADVYRGSALIWAATNGHVETIRALVANGADVNARGTFGGPDHGAQITALHPAAQNGHLDAIKTLLELGADPTVSDAIHHSDPAGWAEFGGHPDAARLLRQQFPQA